jgi:uncharacterized protein (DUF2336 family)
MTVSQNAIILTQSDVERLMRDDSPDSRIEVLEKVSVNYNENSFAAREREVAEHIFRLLMKDATLAVRQTLAERVKANDAIPRDIVLHMAHDVERVSLPILQASTVLSDADLVRIVESSDEISKLMAIAKRPAVSDRVSVALVETSYPQVVSTLLTNETATISERTLGKIIDDFGSQSDVIGAMVDRFPMPVAIVEKLIAQATDAVAAELKAKYNLTDAQIEKDTVGTREDAVMKLLASDVGLPEIEQLVAQMANESRLSASIVMTSLCRGYLNFFRAAIARLANVPTTNATKLLSDKGDLGTRALYMRSGLPESMYDAVRLLLVVAHELEHEQVKPGTSLFANRAVERLLAHAQEQEVENLPYLMALIRQHAGR